MVAETLLWPRQCCRTERAVHNQTIHPLKAKSIRPDTFVSSLSGSWQFASTDALHLWTGQSDHTVLTNGKLPKITRLALDNM